MNNLIVTFLFFCLLSSIPLTGQHTIGRFDANSDIGNCQYPGFVSYQPENHSYIIGGSGDNMWDDHDEFHFLWTTLQGDFILRAEVEFLGSGVHPHRKAGWIVRNNLDANSVHVNAALHGDGLTALQYRLTKDGKTAEVRSPDSSPSVLQLERKGNRFILSTAPFGEELTTIHVDAVPLDKEVYAGLYVCSHDPDKMETAVFRNVRIIRPAPSGFVPYRDYIGSRLEIMDIETGLREVLFTSAHSIQAPNWTPDGKSLIYNSKGHLFRFDLATHEIKPVNTGFAIQNNNDHVLSFDGSLLGISHHLEEENGNSTIYYLPSSGDSMPVRVTKPGRGASYLHGWSPDNKTMIFTGERNGQYDIYTVDVETGAETQLTDQPVLDDGSEYSPDGKYIFFNSARSGKMQIWRMDADGKNQEQLTFDEYNDWFPHVSPDRKWIVFLSFPKDINPGDHPFYQHCLLRIMPYQGGAPKVIAYIYGGQGTINVPSWSPDSRKIAFITNSAIE
ncbi:MAG: SMP-30/gluconolactonase/LRE family protein [bacterium]|jgi:TolB protein